MSCEYRIPGRSTTSREFLPEGFDGVASSSAPICVIKIWMGEISVVCGLPNFNGDGCPIAQYYRGYIDIGTCNERLMEIFGSSEKGSK
jgi:hypothetical protein